MEINWENPVKIFNYYFFNTEMGVKPNCSVLLQMTLFREKKNSSTRIYYVNSQTRIYQNRGSCWKH